MIQFTAHYSTFANYTTYDITKMMIIINIATLRGCHMLFFSNTSLLGIIMLSSLPTKSFNFKGRRYHIVSRAWTLEQRSTAHRTSFRLKDGNCGRVLSVMFSCLQFVFQLLRGYDCVIGDFMISLHDHFVYLVVDIC